MELFRAFSRKKTKNAEKQYGCRIMLHNYKTVINGPWVLHFQRDLEFSQKNDIKIVLGALRKKQRGREETRTNGCMAPVENCDERNRILI